MSNVITSRDLILHLADPGLLVLDCRFALDRPSYGHEQYMAGHVPGAIYLSLNEDLSAPISTHGGRHPLPSVEAMRELFSRLGIERNVTNVVAYDDGGAYAARLWWMLRYLGHDKVRILDGGFGAYLASGGQVSTERSTRNRAAFVPGIRPEMLVSGKDIADYARQGRLIDARAPERFTGEVEPIDIIPGHIPGARNYPWMANLDERYHLRDMVELREVFADFAPQPVMYCGSGVTSCMNVLAWEEAGLPLPRLYVGSWSDWISHTENPIATGSE